VSRRLFDPRQTLYAPHLLDVEVQGKVGEVGESRSAALAVDLRAGRTLGPMMPSTTPSPERSTRRCSPAISVPVPQAIGRGSSWCGARVDLAGRERTLSTQ